MAKSKQQPKKLLTQSPRRRKIENVARILFLGTLPEENGNFTTVTMNLELAVRFIELLSWKRSGR